MGFVGVEVLLHRHPHPFIEGCKDGSMLFVRGEIGLLAEARAKPEHS